MQIHGTDPALYCLSHLGAGLLTGPIAASRHPAQLLILPHHPSSCSDSLKVRLCERFYADEGRPGLPPGPYFRLLLIGCFEDLDTEPAIAWIGQRDERRLDATTLEANTALRSTRHYGKTDPGL